MTQPMTQAMTGIPPLPRRAFVLLISALLALMGACADDESDGSNLSSSGTGASGGDGTGGLAFGGHNQGGSEGCLSAEIEGQRRILIMLIAMDRSGSMAPIWSTISSSLGSFFSAPSSNGISAGFNFFAPPGMADSCDVSDYNPPQYPVGALPGHGGILSQVLDGMILGGETPTYAGLAGSLDWAVTQQLASPEYDFVVVLASDGDPSTCDTDVGNIAALASDALASAGVRTFAIAIQGATVANLDQIAAAGGTGQALDVTADAAAMEQKMNEIREVTVTCDLVIPEPDPSDPFDPSRLNVNLDPDGSGGQPGSDIPQVSDGGSCAGEPGWYYDDPEEPTKVLLCPTTCDLLKSPNAIVRFAFGCPTLVK